MLRERLRPWLWSVMTSEWKTRDGSCADPPVTAPGYWSATVRTRTALHLRHKTDQNKSFQTEPWRHHTTKTQKEHHENDTYKISMSEEFFGIHWIKAVADGSFFQASDAILTKTSVFRLERFLNSLIQYSFWRRRHSEIREHKRTTKTYLSKSTYKQ